MGRKQNQEVQRKFPMVQVNSSNYKSAEVRRREDSLKEKMSSEFLNKYVYPLFGAQIIEEVQDRDRQLKGIDKIFSIDGELFNCDEKAATGGKYWNIHHFDYKNSVEDYKRLNTFCLECYQVPRYPRNIGHIPGWFLNNEKMTDSYLFMWIHDATPSSDNQDMFDSFEDINEVTCCLVRYEDIVSYLNVKGLTEEVIEDTCNSLMGRENRFKYQFVNGTKFNRISSLTEDPINIQLYMDEFQKISIKSVHLKRDSNGKIYKVRDKSFKR